MKLKDYFDSLQQYLHVDFSRLLANNTAMARSAGNTNVNMNSHLRNATVVINRTESSWSHKAAINFIGFAKYISYDHPELIISAMITVAATGLITLGALSSIVSIPSTSLPPTRGHPLYDPIENDLITSPKIEYKDEDEDNGPYSWFKAWFTAASSSNQFSEHHALLMPLMSGSMLCLMYYLIQHDMITFVTRLLRWNIIILSFLSALHVTQFLLKRVFILGLLRSLGIRNSKQIVKKYRIVLSDEDTVDEDTDGGRFAVGSGFIWNLNYEDRTRVLPKNKSKASVDPTSGLVFKESVEFLDKPENYKLKQEYFRELTKPKAVSPERQVANLYFDWCLVVSTVCGLVVSGCYYYASDNWVICNLVGALLSIWVISQLNFKNLRTAVLILGVLFFYDIFFVFGTDIMVTVSTNLEVPAKLVLPSGVSKEYPTGFTYSLIGLGDIVLPGLFATLCHRFDTWKWHADHRDTEFHLLNTIPKYILGSPYFVTSLMSYVAALLLCTAILVVFKAPQPALLYIVPFMLVSVLLVAWSRGELSQFWGFQYDVVKVDRRQVEGELRKKKEKEKEGSGGVNGQQQQGHEQQQQITYKELIDELVEQAELEGDESDAEFTLETDGMFFANSTF